MVVAGYVVVAGEAVVDDLDIFGDIDVGTPELDALLDCFCVLCERGNGSESCECECSKDFVHVVYFLFVVWFIFQVYTKWMAQPSFKLSVANLSIICKMCRRGFLKVKED